MRILHLADVHLDTPFVGRSAELRERLREASREAFRRAVDLALDEEVHAVLVAGDLFDGRRLSFATERFLLDELRRLAEAGARVVYATGNHDPGDAGGRVRSLEWPDAVTVVRGPEPRRVDVTDRSGELVGHVTAAGHASSEESRDLAAGFPRPPGPLPEVALLHAQVVGSAGSEAHDRYAPTELATLRDAGYDYWALGHVHRRQELSAEPPVHYPGNPQGRSPRERGAKGGLLVDLPPGGRATVRFRELGPIRWERLEVRGASGARSLEGLVEEVRKRWDEARSRRAGGAAASTEWILRVVISGGTPLWRELQTEEDRSVLSDELEAALGVLGVEVRTGATHPVVDVEAHRDRPDVVGAILEQVEAARTGGGGPGDPFPQGEELAGFEGGGEGEALRSYVRDLLEGAEEEVLARLLTGSESGEG